MTDTGYRVEMVGGTCIVAAPAVIDISTSDELRRVLLHVAADGHAAVVVDMTPTRFCDLDGFSVLVGAHRRALAEGGGLRLAIPADGPVARVLDLTGVGRYIPAFGSVEEALAARPAAMTMPMHHRAPVNNITD